MQQTSHVMENHDANELVQKIKVDAAMAADPQIAAITKSKSACFLQFEAALRSRSALVPQACKAIASKAKEDFSAK
jgi:hypothetical protein